MVEDSGWISEVIPGDNSTFYFDADNFTGHWVPPENHNHTQVFLNSSEIRSCIITCTEAFNKGWFANCIFFKPFHWLIDQFGNQLKLNSGNEMKNF